MTVTELALVRNPGPDTARGQRPLRRRRGTVLARVGSGLAVLVPIVFLSSFITYLLGALSNSDPAATILGQEQGNAGRRPPQPDLGLDHPLVVQYWDWMVKAVHGDLGASLFRRIPVSESITQRLPVDLSIATLALALAIVIGATAGTVAAIRRGGWFDRGVTLVCSAVSTLPAFVIDVVLVSCSPRRPTSYANGYVAHHQCPQWLEPSFVPGLALGLCRSPPTWLASCGPPWSGCSNRTT